MADELSRKPASSTEEGSSSLAVICENHNKKH